MIKQILDELANESGTNKKMKILEQYKDNQLLRDVLYQGMSKRIKFYTKTIPEYKEEANTLFTLAHALDKLRALSSREVSGRDTQKTLQRLLTRLTPDDADVLKRIVLKKLNIGMGRTNVNKVLGDTFLEKTAYMGAQSYSPKKLDKLIEKAIKKGQPLYSDVKMDGRYANAIVRGGDSELESRQGEATLFTGAKFKDELKEFDNWVFNGEILLDPKKFNRYESNGIIQSVVDIQGKEDQRTAEETLKHIEKLEKKHNITFQEVLDSIQYVVWDVITVEEYFNKHSKTPRNKRYENVLRLTEGLLSIRPIETKLVYTKAEVMEHFQEMLNRGEEGTVLKAFDGEWKDGKPSFQLKFKLEITLDLKITGFNYGTGKNSDVISSFNAESECGLLKTKPQGIKEKEMLDITERQEELLGTIIEVKCSGMSQNSSGEYSLMHPVFKHLRDDKDEANTLEEIKEIEAMAKGLK